MSEKSDCDLLLTMSDLENLRPCVSADTYSAAPHSPLGFLPVCKSMSYIFQLLRSPIKPSAQTKSK